MESKSPYGIRLLIAVDQKNGGPSIDLCGRRWELAAFASISDAPPYTCVSYSWGAGRQENAFEGGQAMSDRALPAAEAAIRASSAIPDFSPVIWIDALCMPRQEPERTVCLRSMGAIYRSATHVIAVLSDACAVSLQKITRSEKMSHSDILALENDGWVTRVWTYQEIANGAPVSFVAEGDGVALVPEGDLLKAVLTDGSDIENAHGGGWDGALAAKYPNLSNLQEVIAEQKLVEYVGRPVFQIMSAMSARSAETEDDRIYAMVGAIPSAPMLNNCNARTPPAEFFMQACEECGDYSFIFSTAPRSHLPGKGWRPTGNILSPIISGMMPVGHGLSGYQMEACLHLDNVRLMRPGVLDCRSVMGFLGANSTSHLPTDIPSTILQRLRARNYCGQGEYLELEMGYFFAQAKFPATDGLVVVASEEVQWKGGGPALLVRSIGGDVYEFCDVGVFIGRLPEEGRSICIV